MDSSMGNDSNISILLQLEKNFTESTLIDTRKPKLVQTAELSRSKSSTLKKASSHGSLLSSSTNTTDKKGSNKDIVVRAAPKVLELKEEQRQLSKSNSSLRKGEKGSNHSLQYKSRDDVHSAKTLTKVEHCSDEEKKIIKNFNFFVNFEYRETLKILSYLISKVQPVENNGFILIQVEYNDKIKNKKFQIYNHLSSNLNNPALNPKIISGAKELMNSNCLSCCFELKKFENEIIFLNYKLESFFADLPKQILELSHFEMQEMILSVIGKLNDD
ncbi:hypothetical protein HK099_002362 [Clydaea vesicula]|uniref:Uncharacterized protein n=1 Tax=Clydaea vesicula TaxID=447962 RepID=A0AAD5Y1E6_9FUNG|nr:hypothetical protein HK099_002362 [Clydaea vesicula]KAJ3397959.1 hypothetical protein HDU92_000060 [Lobulomyces angularis]